MTTSSDDFRGIQREMDELFGTRPARGRYWSLADLLGHHEDTTRCASLFFEYYCTNFCIEGSGSDPTSEQFRQLIRRADKDII
jgi:hypothetical protein